MKKARKTMKNPTHDATTKHRDTAAEIALHPATPLEIRVARALDQELEWYFSYAESALRRESVGMLPSYAAVRVLATEPTDAAVRARALDIARIVRGCMLAMRPRHAAVLRAAYTPRAWPGNVHKAFGSLSAIAVRLAFAEDPWPVRSAPAGLDHAEAMRLSAALASASVSVGRLRSRAQRLLGSAVFAYASFRALEGIAAGVS